MKFIAVYLTVSFPPSYFSPYFLLQIKGIIEDLAKDIWGATQEKQAYPFIF